MKRGRERGNARGEGKGEVGRGKQVHTPSDIQHEQCLHLYTI